MFTIVTSYNQKGGVTASEINNDNKRTDNQKRELKWYLVFTVLIGLAGLVIAYLTYKK